MASSVVNSWWDSKRWLWNIARNMRITAPTTAEEAAIVTFLKVIWDPQAQTGTRSWLEDSYNKKAVATASGDDYQGNLDNEPTPVLVEMLGMVARDFGKIPIQATEESAVDTLIAATGNRRYGATPYFGGVGGSLVTLPS